MTYDKVYKIFISSVGSLLIHERNVIRDDIWKSGHLPIAMEGFTSSSNEYSIDAVIKYLDNSDVVIIVLSHLYGSIINGLNGKSCQLKRPCNKCKGGDCCISYTHFEYLYSIEKKKLVFCIVDNNFENFTIFSEKIKKEPEALKLSTLYHRYNEANKTFINEVNDKFRFDYSNDISLNNAMLRINSFISKNDKLIGLVNGTMIDELDSSRVEITKLRNENEKLNNENIKVMNNYYELENVSNIYKSLYKIKNIGIRRDQNVKNQIAECFRNAIL
ncbi:MAG: DUF4062 domain-containing protein [Ignavibacteriaceae bacterium]|nr:DUF4062 domain-containing protein [Ignavibacteriaceae bacterium]